MSTQTPPPLPSVLQLALKEKGLCTLHTFLCLLKAVSLWRPREFRLGDDVYVLLTLPEDTQRYPIAGKVGWVTPAGAGGNRTQGIGVRFPKDEKSQQLKAKIEQILGTAIASKDPRKRCRPATVFLQCRLGVHQGRHYFCTIDCECLPIPTAI